MMARPYVQNALSGPACILIPSVRRVFASVSLNAPSAMRRNKRSSIAQVGGYRTITRWPGLASQASALLLIAIDLFSL